MSARSVLGIDLRVTSVKLVEIDRKDQGFVLKNWGMTEIPYQLIDKHPQLEDAKADALKKLLQTSRIRSREAVVIVSGSDTVVKLYTLADMPRAEAAQAIRWKLAEEIPYPIEEAVFDFYPTPRGEAFTEKVDYVTACTSRKNYLEASYVLGKAGVKLVGITVLPEALEELFKAELIGPDDKIVSILYMGKRTTNISIFRHGVFEFNRELPLGGETITRAMSGILVTPEGRIEVSPEEAERIKVEYGVPTDLENFPKLGEIPIAQLQAMVRPALEKMQSEVARTFEYYKGQTGEGAINKIILTGGSSLTPNLKEFLSAGIGIPVVSLEPLPKLNPRLAAALGAAATGARRLNLLPEEIKHRWKIAAQKFLKPQYLVMAFTGFLLLIYLFFWLQAFALQTEVKRIKGRMDVLKPRLSKLDAIERSTKEEEQRRLTIRTFEQKRNKVPRILEEISRLIPESAAINTLNLSQTDIHFWGIIFKRGEAGETLLSRFVLQLSLSPLFENIKMVQAVKNEGYATEAFNFEITGKIKD
ncbi:MAG: pilus assembly protein PilM [Candidatus Margulisbacteria bacterium]|jgi:type IV pilus assembly protein PilM|nr:pilus assembly protein PilM [Candidatus Margulisiibacteriota bacterium]